MFPNGRTEAFTCSYDDGKVMDRRLVDIMNQYGIKSTFHLNTGYFGESEGHRYPYISAKEIVELYQGHEIACHGHRHITMTRSNSVQNIEEVLINRKELESLCQIPVTGFSYPNGCYNEEVIQQLKSCGIQYARTTKSTGNFNLPDDYMKWHPTAHHNDDINTIMDKFLSVHYGERLNLFYLWGHSYEFDRDNSWDKIDTFFKRIANHQNVWYVTNGEFYRYMESAKRLVFYCNQCGVYNPSAIDIWIRVDDNVMKVKGGETINLY